MSALLLSWMGRTGILGLSPYGRLSVFSRKNGFETLAVAGASSERVSEVRKKLGWLPVILDDFFSRFPSIAGHVIVLCKKR